MRLDLALITLTLTLAASAQTVANPLAGLLYARQSDSADSSTDACVGACEQQIVSQKESTVQKCAEKANSDINALQKCFCQTGVYDASAGCIQKCFPDGSGDEAEAAIKQQCAELGVTIGSGSGNGASERVRASSALAVMVGAVAVAVI